MPMACWQLLSIHLFYEKYRFFRRVYFSVCWFKWFISSAHLRLNYALAVCPHRRQSGTETPCWNQKRYQPAILMVHLHKISNLTVRWFVVVWGFIYEFLKLRKLIQLSFSEDIKKSYNSIEPWWVTIFNGPGYCPFHADWS